jgi:hypothetical protein
MMSEKTSAQYLQQNWSRFISDEPDTLTNFLHDNSNLPGPRANLTLGFKLALLVSNSWEKKRGYLKKCLERWKNSNDEYLLFCFYTSLGYILAEYPQEDKWALTLLHEGNYSKYWRARESVTFGLSKMLEKRPEFTIGLLKAWNIKKETIILRNTLMALASPKLLALSKDIRNELRDYIRLAMNQIKEASQQDKKKEDYKLLKKSLGFIISVAAVEDQRLLDDMDSWIESGFKVWRTIIKQNLKKKRLMKKHPSESKKLITKLG